VVRGPQRGLSIRDNNINNHTVGGSAIYLDTVIGAVLDNNNISWTTNSLVTTANTADISYLRGSEYDTNYTLLSGGIVDPNGAVTVQDYPNTSTIQGNIIVLGKGRSLGLSSQTPLSVYANSTNVPGLSVGYNSTNKNGIGYDNQYFTRAYIGNSSGWSNYPLSSASMDLRAGGLDETNTVLRAHVGGNVWVAKHIYATKGLIVYSNSFPVEPIGLDRGMALYASSANGTPTAVWVDADGVGHTNDLTAASAGITYNLTVITNGTSTATLHFTNGLLMSITAP
jgi:hypothetical protein